MRWLLWKDYRANRMILGMAVFLLVMPHLSMIFGVLQTPPNARASEEIPNLAVGLIVSAAWSLGLLQLALAFLGGNALAGERMDRTAEFLGYLPASRRQILASKLLVVLGLLVVMWLPNLLIVALAARGTVLEHTIAPDALLVLRFLPFIGSAVFGVAWLASATSRNPVLAVCLGLSAPALAGLALWVLLFLFVWLLRLLIDDMGIFVSHAASLEQFLRHHGPLLAEAAYNGLCLLVAVVCFVVGTRKYLRRVEP